MRIDAYTHFIPEKFFAKVVESNHPGIGKRMRELPAIHDLDVRKKVVDTFKDYAQICAKDGDRFPGWVAQSALGAPDVGVREIKRAIGNGARGAQIYTNVNGRPLDDPEFEPFFAAMNAIG